MAAVVMVEERVVGSVAVGQVHKTSARRHRKFQNRSHTASA